MSRRTFLGTQGPVACWRVPRERSLGWACPATQDAGPAVPSFGPSKLLYELFFKIV